MKRPARRLPTPDAPLVLEYSQVVLTIPANADVRRFLVGALLQLGYITSWDVVGTMTGEEASRIFKEVLNSMTEFSLLGTIVPVYVEVLHSSMLLCDGSVYNKVDFPQLWEVLPSASKDATTLTVPDLRNKFLLGASMDYLRGSVGGLAEVILTEAEMPTHHHTYSLPTFNVDVESVGIPDPTGVGQPALPTSTSSAGGGQAHENMPPYHAVQFAIVAKVQP
jgi:microcystin-dependent protein